MQLKPLTKYEQTSHWTQSVFFKGNENEYIKSFLYNDYSIGYHSHSFYELNIVVDGEGYHYIKEMQCHAKVGSVFLIPPYIKHGYMNTNNLCVYHMLIHRDFLDNCFSDFKQTEGFYLLFEIEPHLRASYTKSIFLTLTESELNILKQDIEIIDSYKGIEYENIFINAVATKILCHLCMLMTKKRLTENIKLKKNHELLKIIDCLNYIHQNYDEKLTLEQLSNMLHISRATLIRHFKKTCGCSPHQYIQQYRIKKAKEIMSSDNKTATCIAQECGFYDVSHMQKYLKEKNTDIS